MKLFRHFARLFAISFPQEPEPLDEAELQSHQLTEELAAALELALYAATQVVAHEKWLRRQIGVHHQQAKTAPREHPDWITSLTQELEAVQTTTQQMQRRIHHLNNLLRNAWQQTQRVTTRRLLISAEQLFAEMTEETTLDEFIDQPT